MIAEDERQAELLEANPLAAALFLWALPAADAYGIIPGNPRKFAARVCPMAALPVSAIQAAIDDLCRASSDGKPGPWHLYHDEAGEPLIYIRNYHRYQEVGWARVGRPKHQLPHCWIIPQDLMDFLEADLPPGSRSEHTRSRIAQAIADRAKPDDADRAVSTDTLVTCHGNSGQVNTDTVSTDIVNIDTVNTDAVNIDASYTDMVNSDESPRREGKGKEEVKDSTSLVGFASEPDDAVFYGALRFVDPLPETEPANGNGQQRTKRKRRGRPARYKARTPEEMDADEAQMRELLQAAGLLADTELLLQAMADNASSGRISQLQTIRTMQLLLYAGQRYGVEHTRAGILAAARKGAGAEYAEVTAKRRWQQEEAEEADE